MVNAVLLPVIAEYNALADHGRYLKIYNYISPIPAYEDEFEPLMLVDAMADDAMKSGNIAVNPRSSRKQDIVELYHKAL